MNETNKRANKPWPSFLDYIFDANMTVGTVRMVGSALAFAVVFGSIFWLLR